MTSTPTTTALEIPVRGMTCSGCARRVQQAIADVPGVASATVDLAGARAALDLGQADPAAVLQAIRDAGYQPAG